MSIVVEADTALDVLFKAVLRRLIDSPLPPIVTCGGSDRLTHGSRSRAVRKVLPADAARPIFDIAFICAGCRNGGMAG